MRVGFQFLVAVRTLIGVQEIAEFNTTTRTFKLVHFVPSGGGGGRFRPGKFISGPSGENDGPGRDSVPQSVGPG